MTKAPHIFSLALLAAIVTATIPAVAAGTAPPSSTKPAALPHAFSGAWFVSAVFPTGTRQGNAGDPHLGTLVVVKADEVSDVNGRRCAAPRFDSRKVKAKGAPLDFAGQADQLQVDCAGRPFATLLLVPGKALAAGNRHGGNTLLSGRSSVLLARRPEALYLLERAEQALYREATIGTAAPAAVAGAEPAPPEKPLAVAPETMPMQPKVAAAANVKPPVKATSEAKANAPVKTTSAAKAAAPAKRLADAAQQQTAKAQKPQADAATKQPATSKKSTAAPGQPAVPDVALLQSDVSGAKPRQGKAAGAGGNAAAVSKPATQQAAAKATKTAPRPGMAIQLASYPGIGAATAGWQSLHSAYPELTTLKPLYVAADNTPVVHLYAVGAAADKLRQICGDLQSKQAYCTLSQ